MTDLLHLFSELVRLETELWSVVDARLRADHDLTLGRFETMRVIARRRPCRVNDVADELVITIGGASKVVDRVEAAGHCRRRGNPDDRRSSFIELTPAGRRMLAAATTTVEDELRKLIGSAVPERALQQLSTTLSTLRQRER